MKKKFLLFGIALATMVTSCYGPNDGVSTEDLDVVFTQKRDGYDFSSRVDFYVSDTVIYIDSNNDVFTTPGNGEDYISLKEAKAIVGHIKADMEHLGWVENTTLDIDKPLTYAKTAIMNAVISKTTYVGGYYPWYGYGYYYPWYPMYYTYSTGSVIVNMYELNIKPEAGDPPFNIIWESFLSGYVRSDIEPLRIKQGIDIGFLNSLDYLDRR